jgi:hypothetical protein
MFDIPKVILFTWSVLFMCCFFSTLHTSDVMPVAALYVLLTGLSLAKLIEAARNYWRAE